MRQAEPPPPQWITNTPSRRPPERIIQWAYGQARVANAPYSWQCLDGNGFKLRTGNQLAPSISSDAPDWWRHWAGVANHFQPVW